MPLVLVQERDVGGFDLIADAVCPRAVVARAADCGSRLLEEGVVAVNLVGERGDPLGGGTVEDKDRFVTARLKLLGRDERIDDTTETLSEFRSGEHDERRFRHGKV